ncbi:MAG TPA: hypothetical protein VFV50_15295 [Bdellovibrionales bacterium]|nr:hypothetical protein [Bdellovibrionales bacterium]
MARTPNEPTTLKRRPPPESGEKRSARSKKEQVLSLFSSGVSNIYELSQLTGSKPSYVASVLQNAGHLTGYFDLYTHTSSPMNVYAQFFGGKLGFKNVEIARRSVDTIETFYQQFEETKDRAGQHHALAVALTMFNRARFCGKRDESEIFRMWLLEKLRPPAEETH